MVSLTMVKDHPPRDWQSADEAHADVVESRVSATADVAVGQETKQKVLITLSCVKLMRKEAA